MVWADLDNPESMFWARHARTGSTHVVAGFEVVVVDRYDTPVLTRLVEFDPHFVGKIKAVMLAGKRVEGRFELRTGG